jgi:hypothetical protein
LLTLSGYLPRLVRFHTFGLFLDEFPCWWRTRLGFRPTTPPAGGTFFDQFLNLFGGKATAATRAAHLNPISRGLQDNVGVLTIRTQHNHK